MFRLTRSVRFSINPAEVRAGSAPAPKHNGYGGWPTMIGVGAYSEFDVVCAGEVDQSLGFFVNIKEIDSAARRTVIPMLAEAVVSAEFNLAPAALLPRLFAAVNAELADARVEAITWRLTPTLSYTLEERSMSECTVRQRFEFAASHRLHSERLSPERNEAIFGKCNWKNGHGHNYRLSVAVAVSTSPEAAPLDLPALERIVDETVIERFDHKHLNLDCPEFAELNPSVENIARVCHDLLRPALADAGMSLREVTVWETEKTSCTYSQQEDRR